MLKKLSGEGNPSQAMNFFKHTARLTWYYERKSQGKNMVELFLDIASDDISALSGPNNQILQDGDEIIIPPSPNYVIVIGEVYNQAAITYYPSQNRTVSILIRLEDQQSVLKKKNIFVIKANGTVIKNKDLTKIALDPGDSVYSAKKKSKYQSIYVEY